MFDLNAIQRKVRDVSALHSTGRVVEIRGPILRATIGGCAIGDLVSVRGRKRRLLSQVVGFSQGSAVLVPFASLDGVYPGAEVELFDEALSFTAGSLLLGSAVNALGQIISSVDYLDSESSIGLPSKRMEIEHSPPEAFERELIDRQLETGIRCIDAFCPIGMGQRMALLAEPGVGKSTLLAAICANSNADVNVIALIGERGREVKELIEEKLDEQTCLRSVVVVATSDEPAILRCVAAKTATRIAEYFRDQGLDVLLVMDSLTRLVRAYRDVGLAAGEVPIRRGYPASVFAALPPLIERAGATKLGSISALYSILTSAELDQDPMIEELIGLTDGHLVLSKELADSGRYPAIDVLASLSRLAPRLSTELTHAAAEKVRTCLSTLRDERDFYRLGAAGSEEFQRAINAEKEIIEFLSQPLSEKSPCEDTLQRLLRLATLV